MSRLRTRIERLLRLRRSELDHTRRRLDQECAICESVSRERAAADEQARDVEGQVRSRLAHGASGGDARSLLGAESAARMAAHAASERHAQASSQESRAREQVIKAWQRVRGLEILRARRDRATAASAARRGERELDDIGRRLWREREQ